MIKLSVIHCSTRISGRTAVISKAFIKGLKTTNNIEINEYQLSEWNIKPCTGCSYCWFKSGGTCIIDDDFSKNIDKISKSDYIIFTSPIWVGNATHLFKYFTGRLYGILKPYFVKNGAYYGHSRNFEHNIKTFLISTCALPGPHNFIPLIEHIKSLDYLCNFTYSGELLKPHSMELSHLNEDQEKILLTNCFNAGKHFISQDEKFFNSVKNIAKPFTNEDDYINFCNNTFTKLIEHNKF